MRHGAPSLLLFLLVTVVATPWRTATATTGAAILQGPSNGARCRFVYRLPNGSATTIAPGGSSSAMPLLTFTHLAPYLPGIGVEVTDSVGRPVAFVPVVLLLLPSSGVWVPQTRGNATLTVVDGIANFTEFTVVSCLMDGVALRLVACPTTGGATLGVLAAAAAGAPSASTGCSDPLNATLVSSPTRGGLAFPTDVSPPTAAVGAPPLVGPSSLGIAAVAGLPLPNVSVVLVGSCGVPVLPDSPMGQLAQARGGIVTLDAMGLCGVLQSPLEIAGGRLVGRFFNLRFSWLPIGMTSVVITLVATFLGHEALTVNPLVATAAVQAPPKESAISDAAVVSVTVSHVFFDMADGVAIDDKVGAAIANYFNTSGRPATEVHSDVQGGSPVLGFEQLVATAAVVLLTFDLAVLRNPIDANMAASLPNDLLRSLPTAVRTIVDAMHANPLTRLVLNRSILASCTVPAQYSPRGLLNTLDTYSDAVRFLPLVSTRVPPQTGGEISWRYTLPIVIGPVATIYSTLDDTLTFQLTPDFFVDGYNGTIVGSFLNSTKPQTPITSFAVPVSGRSLTMVQVVRSIFSISVFANPDIAYVSMLIAVADCSADTGQRLDLSLHPLAVGFGSNRLSTYFVSAIVCNCAIIVLVCALVPYLAVKLTTPPTDDGTRPRLQPWQMKVFPHYAIRAAITLYPGTAYATCAVLPFIVSGYWYPLWAAVTVVYLIAFPVVGALLAYKCAPPYVSAAVSHSKTKFWKKLVTPMGYWYPTHADHYRLRFFYMRFRQNQRWFMGIDFVVWLLTALMATMADCQNRYILPLVLNAVYFLLVMTQLPHVTPYVNAVALISALVKVVGLANLSWPDRDLQFNWLLSGWSVALSVFSIVIVSSELVGRLMCGYSYLSDRLSPVTPQQRRSAAHSRPMKWGTSDDEHSPVIDLGAAADSECQSLDVDVAALQEEELDESTAVLRRGSRGNKGGFASSCWEEEQNHQRAVDDSDDELLLRHSPTSRCTAAPFLDSAVIGPNDLVAAAKAVTELVASTVKGSTLATTIGEVAAAAAGKLRRTQRRAAIGTANSFLDWVDDAFDPAQSAEEVAREVAQLAVQESAYKQRCQQYSATARAQLVERLLGPAPIDSWDGRGGAAAEQPVSTVELAAGGLTVVADAAAAPHKNADRNCRMPPRGHLRLRPDGRWMEENAVVHDAAERRGKAASDATGGVAVPIPRLPTARRIVAAYMTPRRLVGGGHFNAAGERVVEPIEL